MVSMDATSHMIEEIISRAHYLSFIIKSDLNHAMRVPTAGDYHRYAEGALAIMRSCNDLIVTPDLDMKAVRNVQNQCKKVIRDYMGVLNDTIKAKLDIMAEMYVNSGHHALIRQLHEIEGPMMEGLVECYPYAFLNMDDDWCAWVTILK